MAKSRTIFYCTECGNETPKWAGKCPACGAWNTVVEQEAAPKTKSGRSAGTMRGGFHTVKAVSITEVDAQEEIRFSTGMGELDRVLGGGAVKGSLVLVGGSLPCYCRFAAVSAGPAVCCTCPGRNRCGS